MRSVGQAERVLRGVSVGGEVVLTERGRVCRRLGRVRWRGGESGWPVRRARGLCLRGSAGACSARERAETQ